MFVVIAGGGRTGAQLATLLLAEGHKVHLIEHRREVLARIHQELPTEAIYEGNASDPQVLEEAGIREAAVMASCTNSDAANLALCFLAKARYNVKRTIGRINNPRNAWLFTDIFGVDAALNQADLMAKLIAEEMSMGDMMTLLKLRKGEISLVEEKIAAGAAADGAVVRDLKLPDDCTLAAVIRKDQVLLVHGNTVLHAGDEVLAVVATDQQANLAEILGGKRPSAV